ncbi:hypothetical protein CXB51_023200 [Gossypium anomalum]|uniref:Aminotransferase-like plant mobile domain-containing protein n=1 Tax=Gossypium anomalum TaxID=47600 RepID=A0A8J6CQU4_9ROSI|nr:hypothetical protein CXB51_023200 [Gossypium anomalum]
MPRTLFRRRIRVGVVTITLQDVAVQLGLSVNGEAVTGLGRVPDPWSTCERLLGRVPPNDEEGRLTRIKFNWLKQNFQYLPRNPTQMDIIYAARAFILQLIGGILMPDVNQNKVSLMYLPLLEDLELAGRFSWGSAVLACLYRELCRATKPSTKTMGGCCLLLQSWALYRMPFLASVSHQPYVWPLVNRWITVPGIGRYFTVPMYRMMMETHSGDAFIWMPYNEEHIAALIPSWVTEQQQLFVSNVPLINFHMVEWHDGSRVLRQFGCAQPIPNPPVNIKEVHGMDKKGSGRDALNWAQKHEPYIFLWNMRHSRRPLLYALEGGFSPTPEYAAWYMAYGKPFIFQGKYMLIQKDAQPESSRWQPRNAQPRSNRVLPFGDVESDTTSNPDLEPEYEASSSSSHPMDPDPLRDILPLFENIFGDDMEPQHSTRSGSSSYHPELHPEARTPTIEDIFPSAPPITQYPVTPDYGVYDYSTFLSTPDGTPESGPSNYQTPERGARHRRRRHLDRYTPAPGTSPGSQQF